jgi:hypothetical protein
VTGLIPDRKRLLDGELGHGMSWPQAGGFGPGTVGAALFERKLRTDYRGSATGTGHSLARRDSHDCHENEIDTATLLLTGNTETVYGLCAFDLKRERPDVQRCGCRPVMNRVPIGK